MKWAVGTFLCLPLVVSATRYEGATAADRQSAKPVKPSPELSSDQFELTDYDLRGVDLARRQIARGLKKKTDRNRRRDQSFQGLRDVIRDSQDRELQKFIPVVNRLERAMENRNRNDEVSYVEGFIEDFSPLALYLEKETGLPASVMLAQIIVESGWGASNITILKNNILGIGNCDEPGEFIADVALSHVERDVRVQCMAGTTAYRFDSVGESILYYTYLLLENEKNEKHYGALRQYIRDHGDVWQSDPGTYRNQVIELIAEGYHSDPDWYEGYLRKIVRLVDETDIVPEMRRETFQVADASL